MGEDASFTAFLDSGAGESADWALTEAGAARALAGENAGWALTEADAGWPLAEASVGWTLAGDAGD